MRSHKSRESHKLKVKDIKSEPFLKSIVRISDPNIFSPPATSIRIMSAPRGLPQCTLFDSGLNDWSHWHPIGGDEDFEISKDLLVLGIKSVGCADSKPLGFLHIIDTSRLGCNRRNVLRPANCRCTPQQRLLPKRCREDGNLRETFRLLARDRLIYFMRSHLLPYEQQSARRAFQSHVWCDENKYIHLRFK